MSAELRPVPGLRSLYRSDRIIGKSIRTACFGVVVAVGIRWATLAPTDPKAEPSFEAMAAPWISWAGVALTLGSILVLLLRWRFVKRVLSQGRIVPGSVNRFEHVERSVSDDDTSPSMESYVRTYWAVVNYEAGDRDWEVSIKLPGSPSSYGLRRGAEIELIVLDSAPGRPLIRSVYYPGSSGSVAG